MSARTTPHAGAAGLIAYENDELVDGSGVLAEARAAFLHVPLEHFLATPEGRAAADAWERHLNG